MRDHEFPFRAVVAGAMGSGAPQYTGARSETATARACVSNEQPPQTSSAVETIPSSGPAFNRFSGYNGFLADPSFASTVSQRLSFLDGSVGEAVDKCDVGDLCSLIRYRNGDRLAIYSEGVVNCEPYVLYLSRTNGNRIIYAFSRNVDHDARSVPSRIAAHVRERRTSRWTAAAYV